MAKKQTKAPKKKTEQTKIPGTGRVDAIEEIEKAGEDYREKRDARMELQEDESEAQEFLTTILKKHGLAEYVYEGTDGKPYRAYVDKPKAKVKRVQSPKTKKPESE